MSRTGRVERETAESSVLVEVDLDGSGRTDVETGIPFYDHMLAQLGKHGGFDLTVRTKGDLEVDAHHTVEDTAIALGEAFRQALGDKSGLRRFGDALVPLDEALAQVAVDLSGRPYLVHSEPDGMPPTVFYRPVDRGLEAKIAEKLAHLRQLDQLDHTARNKPDE